jgi:hypothetical protein
MSTAKKKRRPNYAKQDHGPKLHLLSPDERHALRMEVLDRSRDHIRETIRLTARNGQDLRDVGILLCDPRDPVAAEILEHMGASIPSTSPDEFPIGAIVVMRSILGEIYTGLDDGRAIKSGHWEDDPGCLWVMCLSHDGLSFLSLPYGPGTNAPGGDA